MRRLIQIILMVIAVVGFQGAEAASPDDLAKSANKLIRSAENAFFAGDLDEASTLLEQGTAELEKLKAENPSHKQIKNLENKRKRLRDRVDKKVAATAPKAPATPKVPGAAAVKPATKDATKLSSGGRSTLKSAERGMDQAETRLEMARDRFEAGNLERCMSQISSAQNYLADADAMLERARRSYKLTEDHPQAGAVFERRQGIDDKIAAFTAEVDQKKSAAAAGAAQAAAVSQSLDDQWLPQVEPFIEYGNDAHIKGPNTNDAAILAKQDANVAKAVKVLAAYDEAVPEGSASWSLGEAVKKVRFAVEVYQNDRNSGMKNLTGPAERSLTEWEGRLAANEGWKEDSGTSLFIVRPDKIRHLKEDIARVAAVSQDDATTLTSRLAKVEQANVKWVEKRKAWDSRPRPFPSAKMTSASLETEMVGLLEDRGWTVENVVITDKDWWVLAGEYRYLQTAVLSKDGDGPFWSSVSFKQDVTLTGYGATELWEAGDKVRLP